MLKTLIIVPTYNERGNILSLVPEIFRLVPHVDILVVDDNSPDQTASVVKDMMANYPRLHILERKKKEGLGRAYAAGFQWALDKSYEVSVEMDADHSQGH